MAAPPVLPRDSTLSGPLLRRHRVTTADPSGHRVVCLIVCPLSRTSPSPPPPQLPTPARQISPDSPTHLPSATTQDRCTRSSSNAYRCGASASSPRAARPRPGSDSSQTCDATHGSPHAAPAGQPRQSPPLLSQPGTSPYPVTLPQTQTRPPTPVHTCSTPPPSHPATPDQPLHDSSLSTPVRVRMAATLRDAHHSTAARQLAPTQPRQPRSEIHHLPLTRDRQQPPEIVVSERTPHPHLFTASLYLLHPQQWISDDPLLPLHSAAPHLPPSLRTRSAAPTSHANARGPRRSTGTIPASIHRASDDATHQQPA